MSENTVIQTVEITPSSLTKKERQIVSQFFASLKNASSAEELDGAIKALKHAALEADNSQGSDCVCLIH